jgi:fructose-bisphosphate aldolase class II
MTLAGTGQLVAAAVDSGRAVAAVNIITLEHAEAIVAAAESCRLPVILQVSQNTVAFHNGMLAPVSAAALSLASLAGVPVALHLDHVTDDALLESAAGAGYSSVMYDGSALAYPDNVARTTQARRTAQAAGLWVEAELGYVGGKPGAAQSAHAPGVRTDPDEAAQFVRDTGVDALAVAVGTSHAMTTRDAALDLGLIEALRSRLPVPLVLHGSSGVPATELRQAVAAGIAKVNVGTALNVAMTAAIRDVLAQDPSLVDPRPYLLAAREEMIAVVCDLLTTVSDGLR